jgi:flagellar biogenesis protein FliO
MKQNLPRLLAAAFIALACQLSLNSNSRILHAQNAPPQNNQASFYGTWNPPATSRLDDAAPATITAPSSSISPKEFRNLFPPTSSDTGIQNSGNLNSFKAPPAAQRGMLQPQPAMRAPDPIHARPLKPLKSFSQPSSQENSFGDFNTSGSPIAAVANIEAAPPESAFQPIVDGLMPPPKDTNTQPMQWPADGNPDSETKAGLSRIWSWLQTSGKESFDGFQKKGGWGEKIGSFIGPGDGQSKKIFGSLAVVLGGYFAFVWVMRKFKFSGNQGIPTEVIEVIGHAPFGPRKNLQLVRLGSKLLLLMNGPEGTHPVGEITDSDEVEYLISLCKGKRTKATTSILSAVKRLGESGRSSTASQSQSQPNRNRVVHPTNANSSGEATVSASQLVQALQALQGTNGTPNASTVYEA